MNEAPRLDVVAKKHYPHGVAVVRPLLAVPHLDRDFEYEIPPEMADDVRFGVAVKVRFGAQDVTGYVVAVRDEPEFEGSLKPLRRLVSPVPVLTPEIYQCATDIAAWQAGSVADVLRLAIPPRHAQAEKALENKPLRGDGADEIDTSPEAPSVETEGAGESDRAAHLGSAIVNDGDNSSEIKSADPTSSGSEPSESKASLSSDGSWGSYIAGPALLDHIRRGEAPGASWVAAPGQSVKDWPEAIAELALATLESRRGVLIIVPDARDVTRVLSAVREVVPKERIAQLSADLGPQARYTAFLRVLRGDADVVIGTRAAMFAPVKNLGLALVWEDGDGLLEEPRAPYPHVRDVLKIRAGLEKAAFVVGGFTRTTTAQLWLNERLLAPVIPSSKTSARVVVTGDERANERHGVAARARIPAQAWQGARAALQHGPVLVQVPRRGYVPALACARCRTKAACSQCHGPLGQDRPDLPPACRWCGHVEHVFTCSECGGHQLRSLVIGAARTAEELGRAFSDVPIKRSGAPEVLDEVSAEPALVISTPGAEPVAEGGYAAAILLDAWALLDRSGLNANERALAAWARAAALVRPAQENGVVFLAGVPQHVPFAPVEALVRWAPAWFAERELAERAEVALPPVTRMASIEGERHIVEAFSDDILKAAGTESGLDVFGPLPLGKRHAFDRPKPTENDGDLQRYLARWQLPSDMRVPHLLRAERGRFAARRGGAVTVRLDPPMDSLG